MTYGMRTITGCPGMSLWNLRRSNGRKPRKRCTSFTLPSLFGDSNPVFSPPPPTVPDPGPVEEDTVPDTVNLLQKRRVHAKQHFCKHCPEGPTSSASPRRFDWQGLTAHMKARSVCDSTRGRKHILLTSLSSSSPPSPGTLRTMIPGIQSRDP